MVPPRGSRGFDTDTGGLTFALSDAFARVAPAVGDTLGDPASIQRWTDLVFGLADRSPGAAIAFIEASPAVLDELPAADLERWANQGRRLIGGGWRSARLAMSYFENGADLLQAVPVKALDHLVEVVGLLTETSPEIAASCIREAPRALANLEPADREPFLGLLESVTRGSRADTDRCLERTPALLGAVDPALRPGLLGLAGLLAEQVGSGAFQLFTEAAEALAGIPAGDQGDVLGSALRLGSSSGEAAVSYIKSARSVRSRLSGDQERRWFDAGLGALDEPDGSERAVSWFGLESAASLEMLASLAGRVELRDVGGVLGLYAEALSGKQLLVQPRDVLAGRRIGWGNQGGSTTDGVSIFLPPAVDTFGEHEANFSVYKVHTTHQAARLEFGSFRFEFGADGEFMPSTLARRQGGDDRPASAARPPMRRYFDLFEDRLLISELFSAVEGTRIDARAVAEYPGIRRSMRRLQDHEAGARPETEAMPLRQAFVENLLRASLGRRDLMRWPAERADQLARALAALQVVERSGATVQDSAEVAAILYDMAASLPNVPPREPSGDRTALDGDSVGAHPPLGATGAERPLPGDLEVPFQSPPQPEYRGEYKPELVQLLTAMVDQLHQDTPGELLTREDLIDLLAGCPELADSDDAGGDEVSVLEELLDNLQSEASERADGEDGDKPGEEARHANGDGSDGIEWYRYDEWDFRAHDYRPAWCALGERQAAEGGLDFYDDTLRHYHGLVLETRRQFERMRPESFRRIRRLEDGHEIDLDEAIQFHADKRAGAGPLARFYSRRNKIDRNVAVALLLDMSASTGEAIGEPAKRIIDVEKESAVLMIEALEAIGDAYGIYGFSGEGRENVEFNVVKELDEPLDDRVRMRIGAVEPVQSTRMGPAIRHVVAKLDAHDAKVKILILVSDGRPQDEDYGRDRDERDYAVHDTRRALIEAKRLRIEPFLITVDSEGHDYLGQMCDDIGYEVVADIEALPRRLPRLYRYVASE